MVPFPAFLADELGASMIGKKPDDLIFAAPEGGVLRVSNWRRRVFNKAVKRLVDLGFRILSTSGTAEVLRRNGIDADIVLKHAERGEGGQSVVDLINAGEVDMVVNSPSGPSATTRADGYAIRAATAAMDKPIVTTVQQLAAAVLAIEAVQRDDLDVMSLQDHAAALDLYGIEAPA